MTAAYDFDTVTQLAEYVLLSYDVPTHLIGFTYLKEAVAYKLVCSPRSFNVIYRFIADKHKTTQGSIMRDISYAIEHSQKLCEFVSLPQSQLFRSRVISNLAIHVKAASLKDVAPKVI